MRAGRHDVRAEDLTGAVILGLRPLAFPEAPDGGLTVMGVLAEDPWGYHLSVGEALLRATPAQQDWWLAHLDDRVRPEILKVGQAEDELRSMRATRSRQASWQILRLNRQIRRVG